jgi:hypothetical protein
LILRTISGDGCRKIYCREPGGWGPCPKNFDTGGRPSNRGSNFLCKNYIMKSGLDAHQNGPVSAQNNGPSKCAGLSTARSLADLGSRLAPTISDETRGSSRVMSCSRCPEHPDRRSVEVHAVHRHEGSCRARGTNEPSTPAGDDARAGQAGAPPRVSNPYFCSTPPEAYFRPDRRTSRAGAHSSGQGRPARQPRGSLAASRPLLDGCEHGGPIGRLGA